MFLVILPVAGNSDIINF